MDWGQPRDPARIDRIAEKFRVAWHLVPDWRMGQLVSNLMVRAKHDIDAAEIYALRHKVPYGIALRVIPVADVMSLGLGITRGGSR